MTDTKLQLDLEQLARTMHQYAEIDRLRSINAELVGALRKTEYYLHYYSEHRELGKVCIAALETVRAALKAASCE